MKEFMLRRWKPSLYSHVQAQLIYCGWISTYITASILQLDLFNDSTDGIAPLGVAWPGV